MDGYEKFSPAATEGQIRFRRLRALLWTADFIACLIPMLAMLTFFTLGAGLIFSVGFAAPSFALIAIAGVITTACIGFVWSMWLTVKRQRQTPAGVGRATWLRAPAFIGAMVVSLVALGTLLDGGLFGSITIGILLTAIPSAMCVFPIRILRAIVDYYSR